MQLANNITSLVSLYGRGKGDEKHTMVCLCLCVSGCDPVLFENTLQLRERRLDLEELLAEEKKSAEALKKECDTLVKKVILCFASFGYVSISMCEFCHSHPNVCVFCWALQRKSVKVIRKAVEDDLELVNREKQQKMNELDVVVPLRLNQVNIQKLWRFTDGKTTE